MVPNPTSRKVRISCELAASFAWEFYETLNRQEKPKTAFAPFDILFMCKEEAGWFWAFTETQLLQLEKNTSFSKQALERFRLKRAGIINHLERTECLLEEVSNFNDEKFICVAAGYKLEQTSDVASAFTDSENAILGVRESSYCFFRISNHSPIVGTQENELAIGSLVAVVRFDNDSSFTSKIRSRLQKMAWVRALVERWRAKVESINKIDKIVRDLARPSQEKTARAAIMSRNFSHNVGSHSLAHPRLLDSVGISSLVSIATNPDAVLNKQIAIKHRLETFHGYAQGRLDFLARAISESGNRPEPLFFLNDVLEGGFFRQGVLLDTLIEDAGFPANKIEFRVSIQRAGKPFNGETTYEWKPELHQFGREKDSIIDDAVVGIPGGMIGAHALYAFMENVMRNAVKYGDELHTTKATKKPPRLEIHLRLEQCKGIRQGKVEFGWVLSVWDNVSSDQNSKVAMKIRTHINESLIDDSAAMRTQGHGIQEMKLCAELLSGGEHGLRFPADHGYHSDENDPRCVHCEKSCTASQEYIKYRKAHSGGAIEESQPLRCYSAPHLTSNSSWLTYNLFIPIPVLIGVVSPVYATADAIAKLPPHVRYFKNVQELAENGAHIGVLLDDGSLNIHETLSDIARLHPCLPFRLMVVTDQDSNGGWTTQLTEKLRKANEPFRYPDNIPGRRLRICGGELGGNLKSLLSRPTDQTDNSFLGAGGEDQQRWDAVVLRAYDAWLRVFKPLPSSANGTWKLCIGFEHGGQALAQEWEKRLMPFTSNDSPCIAAYVLSKQNQSDTNGTPKKSPNWTEGEPRIQDEGKSASDKRYVVFDNHGAVFTGFALLDNEGNPISNNLDRCPRFYQSIGLKDGLSLFQSLESPPASPFGFAFFLHSLVEGALTRVAILDERVSQSAAGAHGRFFGGQYLKFQAAGTFPLLSMMRLDAEAKRRSSTISNRVEEMLQQSVEDRIAESEMLCADAAKAIWKGISDALSLKQLEEGLVVGPTDVGLKAVVVGDQGVRQEFLENIDVFLIHEGVADHLDRAELWDDSEAAVFRLHECAPTIARCSGRGRESRHLHNALPFLEFTEVSENTYQSMNKPALAKGLLGASGDVRHLPKPN